MKHGCISRFEVWVRVQDSAIFEKVGCASGEVRQLKNYLKYFYLYFLYIAKHTFSHYINIYQIKSNSR